jgi:hypothetical protein
VASVVGWSAASVSSLCGLAADTPMQHIKVGAAASVRVLRIQCKQGKQAPPLLCCTLWVGVADFHPWKIPPG